jgi:hypothetical protein
LGRLALSDHGRGAPNWVVCVTAPVGLQFKTDLD